MFVFEARNANVDTTSSPRSFTNASTSPEQSPRSLYPLTSTALESGPH